MINDSLRSNKDEPKIYFSNLDVIRFIAAALVVVFHTENKKGLFGLKRIDSFFVNTIGDYAVTIFFILSGFLITYLLLKEKAKTNTINIPKFYTRRILRIWPLYYLIVLIGCFILPYISVLYIPGKSLLWQYLSTSTILLYLFFLPNIVFGMYGNIPYVDQTWSIGVEEQYYFIWPFVMRGFKDTMAKFLLFILFTIFLSKSFYYLMEFQIIKNNHTNMVIRDILINERFTCMGIGSVGAFILYNKEKYAQLVSFLTLKTTQILTLMAIIFFLVKGVRFYSFLLCTVVYFIHWFTREKGYNTIVTFFAFAFILVINRIPFLPMGNFRLKAFDHELLSIFIAIAILNLAISETSIINIRNRAMLYLGRISYGVYMYHNIFIVLSIYLCVNVIKAPNSNILIYFLTFTLTLIASALSYELFEKYFLSIKKKYMIIKSGA